MMNSELIQETAEAHWRYISQVLQTHGEDQNIIEKVGFHYRSAFIHGWKHGIESLDTKTEEFNPYMEIPKCLQ